MSVSNANAEGQRVEEMGRTERAPRVHRVLMMNRVLGAMTTMASTWAAGQPGLEIVGVERRQMFRVAVWAIRAEGWGRTAPGVLCRSATQPLTDGAAFPCSRCAKGDSSLQVLVSLSRVMGCLERCAFKLCCILPSPRCKTGNNELLVLPRCYNIGRSGYIRGGSGAEGCTQSEGTAS